MSSSAPGERLASRGFVALTLGELAYFVAAGMAIYLVPVHATGPLGADTSGAGLAFGAFACSSLLLRPLAGRLCDTLGRRPLLIGGAAIAAVALLATAHVGGLGGLVGLVVLRLVAGVGEAAVFVASFAAVADLAPAGRMGEAVSYNSLALYVGLAGGPPLAEWVVEGSSPDSPAFGTGWTLAGVLVVVAGLVFATVGETRPPVEGEAVVGRPPLLHRGSIPVALGFLAAMVAMGGFLAFAVLRAREVGLSDASLPLVAYGTIVVVSRITFARLPDRVPPLRLASGALVALGAGLATVAAWASPTGLLVGTAVLALGITFTTPAFFAAVFSMVRGAERGAASATMSATIDLGLGAGPILLGVVAHRAGIAAALGAGAAVAAVGALWTLRQWRNVRQEESV
jgi:predicted MFS family arabinose efflux permease